LTQIFLTRRLASHNIQEECYAVTSIVSFGLPTEHEPDLPPTYQSAWADIDNDGDLDLCTAGKLFRNDATRGHWIELDLVGDGTQVSRSAFGAVARIQLGDRTLTRFVEPGTGEGNQSDGRLHFGLGDHQDPVTVEITWPGGAQQSIESLPVDRRHRIVMESPQG
jgi:hypothetical protein